MLTREQEILRTDKGQLQRELEAIGVQFRGRACRCPFHDDRTASAGIYLDDGVWRFKCQSCGVGGDIFDIRAKINKRTAAEELAAARVEKTPREKAPTVYPTVDAIAAIFPNVEAKYLYTNPDTGRVNLAVIRWRTQEGKKAFCQCAPVVGGFITKQPHGPLPIYNRSRIKTSETVIVVEGEKCVHALADVGIVATTSPEGAGKGDKADWAPLAGKNVFLWPDNDEPEDAFPLGKGVDHMRKVQKILEKLSPAPALFWIEPTKFDLPIKGDAADFIRRYLGWAPENIKAVIETEILAEAEPLGVVHDYSKFVEDTIAGKRRAIEFPWKRISNATKALMPGTITCFCGDPGCGKSLFIVQCLTHWTLNGIKACVYELEDDRNYHLTRAHAQLSDSAQMTETDWVEHNPQFVREMLEHFKTELTAVGSCIWEAPDDQVSQQMLVVWTEERAKAGYGIIIIDPITAAVPDEKPWISDCKFIMAMKSIARRYGTRIVLVVHPKIGQKMKELINAMAGGAAYPRLSHTAIWLECNEDELKYRGDWRYPCELGRPNRIAKIVKTRNGPGRGSRIAFNFSAKTLKFEELGLVECD